jgi:putative DNA primase/helicase
MEGNIPPFIKETISMKMKQSFFGKDESRYISPYKVQKARLLESSEMTKRLLESILLKDSLPILITALDRVAEEDGLHYFTVLLYHFNQTSQQEAAKIYESAERVVETMISEELLAEINQIINVSKAEARGFSYNEKKNSYTFNANAFARHFISRCHICSTNDGRLYLYNKKGVYEELLEVKLGKIIRTLMHEGLWNSWKSTSEVEIVKALQRESIIVDNMNAHRNFINLKNGMLSLETFELLPHHPKYLSTVQIPIDNNSGASAPAFMQFIKEITLDDDELIKVHQEIIGYLLSTETKAEKAFYFYGGGANGKSVLASVVTQLIGKENVSRSRCPILVSNSA